MRKLALVLFAMVLVLGLSSGAKATVWTLVESPGAAGLWPNEANSPNYKQADTGLLGRVVTAWPGDTAVTDPTVANACELAPSYPCATGQPPVFLLPTGAASTTPGSHTASECNAKVTSCATHITSIGEYSYFVIHEVGGTGKGIGFFSGSYTNQHDAYECNSCAAAGSNQTIADQKAMDNTFPGAVNRTLSTDLWITQSVAPFGHASINLVTPNGTGPGKTSVCGNGIQWQNLTNDLCVDGTNPPNGNYQLINQAVIFKTYSTSPSIYPNGTKCNAPDCYIQHVIIPAAMAQSGNAAKHVQVQTATTILPATAPGSIKNATVDTLIFSYTTETLDQDGDGIEDDTDPCPNDPTNGCIADQINGGNCPAGKVFCADSNGYFGCINANLCNSRGDVNQDCSADVVDQNLVASLNAGGAALPVAGGDPAGVSAFNSGVAVGPFDP